MGRRGKARQRGKSALKPHEGPLGWEEGLTSTLGLPEVPLQQSYAPRVPYATWGISLACLALFALQQKFPWVTQRLIFSMDHPFDPIRWVGAPLIHASLGHLVSNVLLLFVYGSLIEETIEERKNVLKIFFHGAFLGQLFCILFNPMQARFGLGASGGTMALLTYFFLRFSSSRIQKTFSFEGFLNPQYVTVSYSATFALALILISNVFGFYVQYHQETFRVLFGPDPISYLQALPLNFATFFKTAFVTLFLVFNPYFWAGVFKIGFAAHLGGMAAAALYWLFLDRSSTADPKRNPTAKKPAL